MTKPVTRGAARLLLGVIFYRFKRHISWWLGSRKYAKQNINEEIKNIYASHATPLIRNLKNVDMYMQQNKIVNLKLAVNKVNRVILYPGEYFSY